MVFGFRALLFVFLQKDCRILLKELKFLLKKSKILLKDLEILLKKKNFLQKKSEILQKKNQNHLKNFRKHCSNHRADCLLFPVSIVIFCFFGQARRRECLRYNKPQQKCAAPYLMELSFRRGSTA